MNLGKCWSFRESLDNFEYGTLPFYISLFRDSFNFFYIFQLFALSIWFYDGGYKYATMIVIMMVCSIYGEIVDIRENVERLK